MLSVSLDYIREIRARYINQRFRLFCNESESVDQ